MTGSSIKARDTPEKHALLVGIDEYPRLEARYQLSSCVRDIELLARVLSERFGFSAERLALLRNREATRGEILAALEDLIEKAGMDDVVVVHFSGHGSRRRTSVGHEADGWEETVVPCDSGRDTAPNRDISDNELYDWLLRLSAITPYVTLIIDSCYSGTVVRDPAVAQTRWVEEDPRPRRKSASAAKLRGSLRETGPSGWLPLSERYVLLAGCLDRESAYVLKPDGKDRPAYGALTYFLCRELLKVQRGATYRDVFDPMSRAVTAEFPSQHPQLEGARDREVFGLRRIAPQAFLPIEAREGRSVILGGGAVHGLSAGSEWEVYPPGTKRFGDAGKGQARVRLSTVRTVEAEGEILEEDPPGAVQPGARAIERAHGYHRELLPVAVHEAGLAPELAAALSAKIAASPLLTVTGSGEAASVTVSQAFPGVAARPGALAPGLERVDGPVWALTAGDGELLLRPVPAESPDAVMRILEGLENRARVLNCLALDNPDLSNPLKGLLRVELLRRRPGEDWQPAEPEAGGGVVYRQGDRLALTLENGFSSPLYVHVLDLGMAGGIDLIYPIEGAREALASGRKLTIGVREGEELEVRIPADLPQPRGPLAGTEHLKIIATSEESDLTWLKQDRTRRPGPGGLLERLVARAIQGEAMREAVPLGSAAEETWTAVTRSFVVRRREAAA